MYPGGGKIENERLTANNPLQSHRHVEICFLASFTESHSYSHTAHKHNSLPALSLTHIHRQMHTYNHRMTYTTHSHTDTSKYNYILVSYCPTDTDTHKYTQFSVTFIYVNSSIIQYPDWGIIWSSVG